MVVQDEVLTPLFDGMIAEEKIFIENIRVPEDASVEDITSIFRFKGKDYIVEKPKTCLHDPVIIQETLSEIEERGLRKLLRMSTSSDPLGLLNPSGEKVYKKLADDDEPLYEGSPQSKYQFALALYNWKIECNVRDAGFELFLRLFKSALPGGEKLAGSIDEMKKVLEKLGIAYEEVSEEQEEVDDDSDDSNEDGDDHE